MKAFVLETAPGAPIERDREVPRPERHQVLIRVEACGVCRTDLHLVDGELSMAELPVVPGHQIVGVIEQVGEGGTRWKRGDRIGVPWLGWTCGRCAYCLTGRENLCDEARFTGCQLDGGFAEYTLAHEDYCFEIPAELEPDHAAPLLCAGLIGLRTLRKAGDVDRIGIYGFGSAAHIVAQIIRHEGRRLFAFVRPGDREGERFARESGAEWAGGSDRVPPEPLDAALIFAPAGSLVPTALRSVRKGGRVVCGGIHMSDIPAFPYELIWGERSIESVANLTRRDGAELLDLARTIPIRTEITRFPLSSANEALASIRSGRTKGSAVLTVASTER